jgi:capsular exopolysaccharide synthesis family protein
MSRIESILKLSRDPPEPAKRAPTPPEARESGSLEMLPVSVPARVEGGEWKSDCTRFVPAQLSVADALRNPTDDDWYAAEQYRIARTKILQRLNRPLRLLVSSASVGDGKTLTSINLAVAMALSGKGLTLLLDADLRAATVHEILRLPKSPGLAEVLAGAATLQEAIVGVREVPGLYVLPAGRSDAHPTELFDGSRWPALADNLRNYFAHIIVDSPPVGVVAEQELIASACDGVLVVVRPDHTERALLFPALAQLKPRLVGVLVNAAEDWLFWRKSARRSYSYYRRKEIAARGE